MAHFIRITMEFAAFDASERHSGDTSWRSRSLFFPVSAFITLFAISYHRVQETVVHPNSLIHIHVLHWSGLPTLRGIVQIRPSR